MMSSRPAAAVCRWQRRFAPCAALAASLALSAPAPALACGPDTDCAVGDRTYRIALPDGEGPFGALVYMHGYRGSAAGTMSNAALRAVARDLGVALIAAKSGGEDWLIRNAPRKDFEDDTRELAYFDALLDDAAARFPLDRSRMLATGFSAGGMMTWTLACHRAESFAAFAPIAGTFWAPIPERCPNPPVDLVHINGTSDSIVPIEGRPIADTRQGNSREAMAMFVSDGGYDALAPVEDGGGVGLACEAADGPQNATLMFCTHPGGHSIQAEWVRFAWETLMPQRPPSR